MSTVKRREDEYGKEEGGDLQEQVVFFFFLFCLHNQARSSPESESFQVLFLVVLQVTKCSLKWFSYLVCFRPV